MRQCIVLPILHVSLTSQWIDSHVNKLMITLLNSRNQARIKTNMFFAIKRKELS